MTRYPSTAPTKMAAGESWRTGSGPAIHRKEAAAAPIPRVETAPLNTRLWRGRLRPTRITMRLDPPATSIARKGSSTRAAANVAVSTTLTLSFIPMWIARRRATVAMTKSVPKTMRSSLLLTLLWKARVIAKMPPRITATM